MMNQKTPVDRFYDSRADFTIIGLTGLAGSGCSTLAELMADDKFWEHHNVRVPNDIIIEKEPAKPADYKEQDTYSIKATAQLVFKRKYTICYNYIKENYKEYKVIKYIRVAILYTLLYAIEKNGVQTPENLKSRFSELLKDKFYPSKCRDERYKDLRKYGESVDVSDVLDVLDWAAVYNSLEKIVGHKIIENISNVHIELDQEIKKEIADYFFENNSFKEFVDSLTSKLKQKDYYCLCFFFHRLTSCIRNSGDPFKNSTENIKNPNDKYDHLFDIVKLINLIIKGLYRNDADKANHRSVVIDSIRNSMEALFFKERYTAFYFIAVHDDEHRESNFKKKVLESVKGIGEDIKNEMHRCLMSLMDTETLTNDYEDGIFYSPNVGQCISDAEIHIANVSFGNFKQEEVPMLFYSMAEQWMKYAALILHPGLITPSSEERCMIVAYTAKYNSGCLSRQVGACLTNQYHTIRTIGWNDVPYGQIPCSLRDLSALVAPGQDDYCKDMFSSFERDGEKLYDDKKCSFKDKVKLDFPEIEKKSPLGGLPFSYCFKTLHNRYEGEKNQVYTRSLHAEENAMMQMVKYGGEALINGIIYVTASPCELCSKKLYQIGVRKIVYIDPYPGISKKQIISCGFKRPQLKLFQGAYGSTYFKLYQPFMSYKDEVAIRVRKTSYVTNDQILKCILDAKHLNYKATYSAEERKEILNSLGIDPK